MSNATSDMILERRRMRRRLAFWRIVAIIGVLMAIILVLPRPGSDERRDHIARVDITGVILADPERDHAIARLAEDDKVQAVIVRINSPGGSVAGSEALYETIRGVAGKKPVVAVMSEAAASGGYVAALATDHIVARQNTITGSIGVVAEIPNFTGLLDMLGVNMNRIKSAPLKAEPSVTTPPEPGSIEAQEELIEDAFAWFKGLVGERRGLEGARLDEVSDGRAFTGGRAVELGLVDRIGGEDAAVEWLASRHDIDPDLRRRDVKWGDEDLPWPLSQFDDAASVAANLPRGFAPGPRLYAIIQ